MRALIASDSPYFDPPPLALAHRGGSEYAPNLGLENTLTAFRNAVDLGYTYLETDVHLTSDGVLVAAHDDSLDRVTDGSGRIAELPWDTVRAARIGTPGAGSAADQGSERIPTLVELLDAFPAARLNIDLKAPGTADALWRILGEHAAYDRVCVGSFSERNLWRFRRLARGRVATSAGQLGTAALRLLPYAVTRVLHTPGLVFQVPVRHRLGPVTVEVVTRGFVRRAHRLGKQVHVWTIDDPGEMRRLLDLGVDGIVTDRPDVLLDVLAAR